MENNSNKNYWPMEYGFIHFISKLLLREEWYSLLHFLFLKSYTTIYVYRYLPYIQNLFQWIKQGNLATELCDPI